MTDSRTDGRHMAHETDARDTEEDPNSEEEEPGEEETELTAAFEREMDELASVVEELEDTLDVQDVEDLREVSGSMYEGLATIRERHAPLTQLSVGSRQSSVSGIGRGKGKTKPKSVQLEKLITHCFDCNRFGHWSGDPYLSSKKQS